MAKLYNLARMKTATIGSGSIVLGLAVDGCLTFNQAGVQDGDTVSYGIFDGINSEVGRGVYTTIGTTLTRSVLKSTNSNLPIVLSGTAEVFITALAEDFILPPSHDPVTLGAGSDAALSLSGQELILADVLTPTEHTNIGNGSPHHAAVTLGAGSDAALTLSGQELILADVLTPTEHANIGDSSPHHAAVTLGSDADTFLELTGQQLALDNQNPNTVLAGPSSGAAADPTFRVLVNEDIPSGTFDFRYSFMMAR